jgi:photosystem II stability/assembly factor-like uncharacterized protein
MKALASLLLVVALAGSLHATPKHGTWVPIGSSIFPTGTFQILAGAGETVFFLTAKNGVYLSTDAGQNWQTMNVGLPSLNISHLYYSPDGRVLARSDSGWFSNIGNASWDRLPDPDTAVHFGTVVSAAFDSHGTAYFASDVQGIFRLNADNTYTRVVDGRLLPPFSDFIFDAEDRIIALLGYTTLYRFNADFTLDRTWKNIYGQLLKLPWGGIMIARDSIWVLQGNAMAAYGTKHNPPYIVDSSGVLYDLPNGQDRSTDNGKTWQDIGFGLGPMGPIVATRYGLISLATDKPSIYTSRDSGSTTEETISLSNQLTFYAIFTDKAGRLNAFDSLGEHWVSYNRGVTWGRVPSVPRLIPFYGDDGRYYVTVYNQNTNVWMSEDGGVTYHAPPHPHLSDSGYFDFFAAGSGNFYSCSDSGELYRSTDQGMTWLPIRHFLNFRPHIDHCYGVVEHEADVWTITQLAIHYSSDNGASWDVTSDQTGRGSYSRLISGRGRTVFVYMNNLGYEWLKPLEPPSYATWIEATGPLVETSDSDAIAFHPYVSTPFYRDVLIHQTHDLTQLDTLLDGPDTLSIEDMALDSAGDVLGVGYPSRYIDLRSQYLRGIYEFRPEGSSVAQSHLQVAPHLWATTDGRSITAHSDAMFSHVTVFDMLGRIRLSQDVESRNECRVGAQQLSSGFYRIAVSTKSGEISTKLLLVR